MVSRWLPNGVSYGGRFIIAALAVSFGSVFGANISGPWSQKDSQISVVRVRGNHYCV